MTNYKNILFPIESIKREFDYKLFLAVMICSDDTIIYIGQHNVIDKLLSKMKIGIYFGKNIFKEDFPEVDLSNYEMLKKRGFNLVYLDEEGGIYPGDELNRIEILKRRLDPSILSDSDVICSWGDQQKNSTKFSSLSINEVTGHPKFDLYKAKYRSYFHNDINKLKEKYPKFILIDTMYTSANHCYGSEYSHSLLSKHKDFSERVLATQEWAYQYQMLSKVVSLVISLSSKFQDYNFVVRPHPGEDSSIYKEIFFGINNIIVSNDGPVSPWILSSSVLIHNNCSTAIEANFGEIPVITYDPIDYKNKVNIANNVGVLCKTEEDVIKVIGSLEANMELLKANQFDHEDKAMLQNISNDSLPIVKRILEQSIQKISSKSTSPALFQLKFMELKRKIFTKVKHPLRILFQRKMKFFKANSSIFYGFDKMELKYKLEQIEKITGKRVKCTYISDHLFTLKLK